MNVKTIISVLVVAAVVSIGGILLLRQSAQPKPEPIPALVPPAEVPEDWKTYRDDVLGFEVSYSSDWNLIADDGLRNNSGSLRTVTLEKDDYVVQIRGSRSPLEFGGGLLLPEYIHRYVKYIIDDKELWREKAEEGFLSEGSFVDGARPYVTMIAPTFYDFPHVFGSAEYVGEYDYAFEAKGNYYSVDIFLPSTLSKQDFQSGTREQEVKRIFVEADLILQTIRW